MKYISYCHSEIWNLSVKPTRDHLKPSAGKVPEIWIYRKFNNNVKKAKFFILTMIFLSETSSTRVKWSEFCAGAGLFVKKWHLNGEN